MLHHLRDIITYMLKVSIPCVVDVIASSSRSASRTKICEISNVSGTSASVQTLTQ